MTQEEREDLAVAMMPFAELLNLYDGDGFWRRASGDVRDQIEGGLDNAGLTVEHVRQLHRTVLAVLLPPPRSQSHDLS